MNEWVKENLDMLKSPKDCEYSQLEKLLASGLTIEIDCGEGDIEIIGQDLVNRLYYCSQHDSTIWASSLPDLFRKMYLQDAKWRK